MKRKMLVWLVVLMLLAGCDTSALPTPPPDRESLIPAEQAKITPETDIYPLVSETDEYDTPVPMPYPVNTAGAEDSAFMMPDGQTLYVWFTPSPQVPVEKQVIDGVTGIYVFHKTSEGWSDAERVMLQDPGKLSLDGCGFVQNNIIWFCAAREGYTGLHWFTAELKNGVWQNWQLADFEESYEVGELHITADGSELYFHSARAGGQGEYDIWMSQNIDGVWQEPENLAILNTPSTEGWPFISPDGNELWLTRAHGAPELWRSKRINGEWTEPQKMFSLFSGEASMDNKGNIYFTHHFFKNNVMLEADIYVAYKR
jgi:hypothetical protein